MAYPFEGKTRPYCLLGYLGVVPADRESSMWFDNFMIRFEMSIIPSPEVMANHS